VLCRFAASKEKERDGGSSCGTIAAAVQPNLSILVVTHNERELVKRSLPPLLEQLGEHDELIVADNDSADGTVEEVERLAPRATVIRMERNDGYMSACNAAAERARGQLLVTLDADAVVAPGFCQAIRRPAVEGRGWDGWMGILTMEDGRKINTSGGISHFTGISWAGQVGAPVEKATADREPAFLTGACLTMARKAWERDPGFPPEYFLYFDDVDWSFRARLYGGRLGVEPSALVDHLYDFARRSVKWRQLERNRWATIIRTYPWELLLVTAPALVATEAALVVVAARRGWLREKLRSWVDVLRWLPRLLRQRREIQARRAVSALEFARPLTADLSSPYLGRSSRSLVLRAGLRAYWSAARALLRLLSKSPRRPRAA
jgi:GT2 family glycosyltransferase